ncbi:MAG: M48 family metalloprotease [Myxococcales bacterium]|nr:M48 family metalloprotease [Myxococcales bacterium]MCB9519632.1 M48 family metalloprotease [Myxococcales bacterium]MCB9530637.1 M48 family metalloprotease [Myxococcales bacterium]
MPSPTLPPATRRRVFVAFAAASLWLFACSGVQTAVGAAENIAASVLLPVDQEIALGVELDTELRSELTMHPDAELQAYVARLGAQVVAVASDRDPAITFSFVLVDDDETVNAFAIPGGFVYVYSGLMQTADTEAELMAVLSHEVSHVTQRHVAERLVAAYGLEAATAMALGRDPGLVAQIASQVVQQGVMLRYSREAESEADRVGFGYLVRAGYSPQGFVDFFTKLSGGAHPPEFLSTHPNPENRVAAIQAMMRGRSDLPTRENEAEYAAMKARL